MYGFFTTYDGTVEQAREAVIKALAEEGFGALGTDRGRLPLKSLQVRSTITGVV